MNGDSRTVPKSDDGVEQKLVKISEGNENEASNEAEEPVLERPKWSQVLATTALGTPTAQGKSGNGHGLGLQAAAERSKKLTRSGRLCATLLYDVGGHFDTYGQAILKALHNLPVATPSPVQSQAGVASGAIKLLSEKTRSLASSSRSTVARPMHSSLQSMGETVPNIYQRYSTMQSKSATARSQALRARARYVKAVQEAENAFTELKKTKAGSVEANDTETQDETSKPGAMPWETVLRQSGLKCGVNPSRLIQKLRDVQANQSKYTEFVKEENRAVKESLAMETIALESLQELEDQRLNIFVESITRFVKLHKSTFGALVFSLSASTPVQSPSRSDLKMHGNGEKNSTNDFFKNLLKPVVIQSDELLGVMEAEAIGFPEEVGQLRDDIVQAIQAQEKRSLVVKSIASCLEDVASASGALASNLVSRLNQDGYGGKKYAHTDSLYATLRTNEGSTILTFWTSLVGVLERIADGATALAKAVREVRHSKFDSFLLGAERQLRSAGEADENRWKILCEAGRAENKAENRFTTSTNEHARARVRVQSLDNGRPGGRERTASLTAKITPGMGKAIGNMIAILPNRGEHAMKMMTPDARRVVAQTSLNEADMRTAKDKEAFENAKKMKDHALKVYKNSAVPFLEKLRSDDERGWADLGSALDLLVSSLQDFRQAHVDAIQPLVALVPTKKARLSDVIDWTTRTRAKLGVNEEVVADRSYASMLSVLLVNSRNVQKLLSLQEGEEIDFKAELAPLRSEDGESAFADDAILRTPKKERQAVDSDEVELSYLQTPERSTEPESTLSTVGEAASNASEGASDLPATPSADLGDPTSVASKTILSHFLSDRDKDEKVPEVMSSFTCAYWPKEAEGFISRIIHGRLFVTKTSFYFIEWGGKKLILDWNNFTDLRKEESLMGSADNSLRITCTREGKDKSYFFGSFTERDDAFEVIDKAWQAAKEAAKVSNAKKVQERQLQVKPVPPDATLKKMEILLTRTVKNVSIRNFYENVWSEGQKTDAKPFYKPFLEDLGSMSVVVGDWEFAKDDDSYKNEWCGESYQQRRKIRFEFKRTTHLYVGPPIAIVHQTHHCRCEGEDKCVVSMTGEMEGIPYADCFAVEVRWVATRLNELDLKIEVGLFVNFKKSTMFAKQIRTGTVSETKPIHAKLLDQAIKSCAGSSSCEDDSGIAAEVEAVDNAEPLEDKSFMDNAVQWAEHFTKLIMEGDPMTLGLTFLFVFLILRWLLVPRKVPDSPESALQTEEVIQLRSQINQMELEMRQMRAIMEELVSLVKASSMSKDQTQDL